MAASCYGFWASVEGSQKPELLPRFAVWPVSIAGWGWGRIAGRAHRPTNSTLPAGRPLLATTKHFLTYEYSLRVRPQVNHGRIGKARQGKARQGKARQGKARQGKARQGKARQGKAKTDRDARQHLDRGKKKRQRPTQSAKDTAAIATKNRFARRTLHRRRTLNGLLFAFSPSLLSLRLLPLLCDPWTAPSGIQKRIIHHMRYDSDVLVPSWPSSHSSRGRGFMERVAWWLEYVCILAAAAVDTSHADPSAGADRRGSDASFSCARLGQGPLGP
ncbi:uncharacterized protein PG998_001445 [Apiospora kogelbergensis]|uniref:uncharacterized protein n=1 Tax=Apiospora kogelbergensis TaxID=1337665 RepID=UPI00312DDB1F